MVDDAGLGTGTAMPSTVPPSDEVVWATLSDLAARPD
jgi:hypothetical protein